MMWQVQALIYSETHDMIKYNFKVRELPVKRRVSKCVILK